jgi:hypothetical protein
LLSLAQNGGEVPPAEGEPMFDMSSHNHCCAVFGNSEVPGDDPQGSSAIVSLEYAATQRSEGIRDPPGDADFFASVAARIPIQVANADARRTSGKQDASDDKQKCSDNSSANCEHTFLQNWNLISSA